MKISVVTISYNQAKFLPACIESVAAQEGSFEHIMVDPGSMDGSREIIEANRACFSHIVLEKDDGPADGLNRGFALATGEIYYYLNADDVVLPGAFAEAREFFKASPDVDVISGNGYVIDKNGSLKRRLWSDPISRLGLAHGGNILIQPSTFVRKKVFENICGFNVKNKSCWDAELIRDLFEHGAKFALTDKFWSGYRVYEESITGSGRLNDSIKAYGKQTYERLTGGNPNRFSKVVAQYFRVRRIFRHPELLIYKMKFYLE